MQTVESIAAPQPLRPPHPVTGEALAFDLFGEARALMNEAPWLEAGHNAKTLLKQGDLCVVLIALRAGARLHEHQIDHPICVQTLAGHLHLHLPDRGMDLEAGCLAALDRHVLHEIEAVDDSVFLMTLGPSPH